MTKIHKLALYNYCVKNRYRITSVNVDLYYHNHFSKKTNAIVSVYLHPDDILPFYNDILKRKAIVNLESYGFSFSFPNWYKLIRLVIPDNLTGINVNMHIVETQHDKEDEEFSVEIDKLKEFLRKNHSKIQLGIKSHDYNNQFKQKLYN